MSSTFNKNVKFKSLVQSNTNVNAHQELDPYRCLPNSLKVSQSHCFNPNPQADTVWHSHPETALAILSRASLSGRIRVYIVPLEHQEPALQFPSGQQVTHPHRPSIDRTCAART